MCSWSVQDGCTDGRFLAGAPKTGLQCQKVELPLQIHVELFFFFFFFSMATQLGEIPFLTESSVSLKNIKSMTDLLSIGFPKDPGIPSWTSLGIHNLISGRC